jgi:group I intron endonuclease
MRWLVYKHTSPSGKVYIGITSQNPQSRWNKGKGYKGCIKFFNAILKYGWDNIEHTILADNLTKEEAETVEKSLISHYKSLNLSYNITDGGEGRLGYHVKLSNSCRDKISKAHIGLKHSDETKAKMSKSRKGRGQTSSWVAKRVKSHYVKIEAYIGNKWVKFNSIKEASIVLGIEQRNISAVCRGLRKTAGKIKFRYYECS